MPRTSVNCCGAWRPAPTPTSCAGPARLRGKPRPVHSRRRARPQLLRRPGASRAAAGKPLPAQSFRRLMSSLIDRLNLVWLLRYRFNYKLPPAQVYFLLVASRYTPVLGAIAQTGGAGQPGRSAFRVAGIAARTAGGSERHSGSVRENGARHRRHRAARYCTPAAPAIARAFAYLILREHDLRAVRAVLRGRLLGLPEADIRLAMFHPAAGSA